jgi:hypothetical protein
MPNPVSLQSLAEYVANNLLGANEYHQEIIDTYKQIIAVLETVKPEHDSEQLRFVLNKVNNLPNYYDLKSELSAAKFVLEDLTAELKRLKEGDDNAH